MSLSTTASIIFQMYAKDDKILRSLRKINQAIANQTTLAAIGHHKIEKAIFRSNQQLRKQLTIWDKIDKAIARTGKNMQKNLGMGLKKIGEGMKSFFSPQLFRGVGFVSTRGGPFSGFINAALSSSAVILRVMSNLGSNIIRAFAKMASGVAKLIGGIAKSVGDLLQWIPKGIGGIVNAISKTIGGLTVFFGNVIEGIGEAFASVFETILRGAATLAQMMGQLFAKIASTAGYIVGKIAGLFSEMFEKIIGFANKWLKRMLVIFSGLVAAIIYKTATFTDHLQRAFGLTEMRGAKAFVEFADDVSQAIRDIPFSKLDEGADIIERFLAASTSKDPAEAVEAMRYAAEFAAVAKGDITDAATAMITTNKEFGIAFKEIGPRMFNAVENAQIRLDAFVVGWNRFAAALHGMGMSFEEILGYAAVAMQAFPIPRTALMEMQSLLDALIAPSERGMKIMRKYGMEFKIFSDKGQAALNRLKKDIDIYERIGDAKGAREATAAYNDLHTTLGKYKDLLSIIRETEKIASLEERRRLIGNKRAWRGYTKVLSFVRKEGYEGTRTLLNKMYGESEAYFRRLELARTNIAGAFSVLGKSLNDIAVAIGTRFKEDVVAIIDKVSAAIRKLADRIRGWLDSSGFKIWHQDLRDIFENIGSYFDKFVTRSIRGLLSLGGKFKSVWTKIKVYVSDAFKFIFKTFRTLTGHGFSFSGMKKGLAELLRIEYFENQLRLIFNKMKLWALNVGQALTDSMLHAVQGFGNAFDEVIGFVLRQFTKIAGNADKIAKMGLMERQKVILADWMEKGYSPMLKPTPFSPAKRGLWNQMEEYGGFEGWGGLTTGYKINQGAARAMMKLLETGIILTSKEMLGAATSSKKFQEGLEKALQSTSDWFQAQREATEGILVATKKEIKKNAALEKAFKIQEKLNHSLNETINAMGDMNRFYSASTIAFQQTIAAMESTGRFTSGGGGGGNAFQKMMQGDIGGARVPDIGLTEGQAENIENLLKALRNLAGDRNALLGDIAKYTEKPYETRIEEALERLMNRIGAAKTGLFGTPFGAFDRERAPMAMPKKGGMGIDAGIFSLDRVRQIQESLDRMVELNKASVDKLISVFYDFASKGLLENVDTDALEKLISLRIKGGELPSKRYPTLEAVIGPERKIQATLTDLPENLREGLQGVKSMAEASAVIKSTMKDLAEVGLSESKDTTQFQKVMEGILDEWWANRNSRKDHGATVK